MNKEESRIIKAISKKNVLCPKCSSLDVNKNGFVYTTEGKKQRFLCKKCGHIWREN